MSEVKALTKRQLQTLLDNTASASKKSHDLLNQCHAVLAGRYGVDYKEIDAEILIDALEYGEGITVEEADEEMERLGYPIKS